MTQSQARYDEFAEWYEQWSSDMPPLIAAQEGLLPEVTGDRVLDIGCGQGRMCRHLASLGADVTGVDVSAAMLERARAAGPASITYVHADVAGRLAWWDGRPFDGCTCEMALMDIDDLADALSAVTAVLRPGGWFVASIVHPCLPGSERGASSWPPGQGYEYEGWWISSEDHSPEGVRIRVGATHRKLSTYLNALRDAGLEAERFVEPPAPLPTYCCGGAAAGDREYLDPVTQGLTTSRNSGPVKGHLPARHPGARRSHRRGHGQAVAAAPPEGQDGGRGSGHGSSIGHPTGARPETRFLKIV